MQNPESLRSIPPDTPRARESADRAHFSCTSEPPNSRGVSDFSLNCTTGLGGYVSGPRFSNSVARGWRTRSPPAGRDKKKQEEEGKEVKKDQEREAQLPGRPVHQLTGGGRWGVGRELDRPLRNRELSPSGASAFLSRACGAGAGHGGSSPCDRTSRAILCLDTGAVQFLTRRAARIYVCICGRLFRFFFPCLLVLCLGDFYGGGRGPGYVCALRRCADEGYYRGLQISGERAARWFRRCAA